MSQKWFVTSCCSFLASNSPIIAAFCSTLNDFDYYGAVSMKGFTVLILGHFQGYVKYDTVV